MTLLLILILLGTDAAATGEAAVRGAALVRYNLDEQKPLVLDLPRALTEASGLAVSADGNLFCHDDERGVIYLLDPRSGNVVSRFSVGSFTITGDFEGIAAKGDTLFLATSDGTIFRFRAAKKGARVRYDLIRTRLTGTNDIEGLEYDPETDCLLLACKGRAGLTREERKRYRDVAAVYALSLASGTLRSEPRFLIPRRTKGKKGSLSPSGLARHPQTGTFLLVSAASGEIVEVSAEGRVLARKELNTSVNRQAEGIAVLSDGTLVLCNEGKGRRGRLVLYPMSRPQ